MFEKINVIFGISAVQNLRKDTFILKIANFDKKLAKFGNFDQFLTFQGQ